MYFMIFFSLQLAWMGVNIYLFVSSFISLQTSKSNFYLRVIVKVNIKILLNVDHEFWDS